jgi:flagellar hook-associated protein 1 FlgK
MGGLNTALSIASGALSAQEAALDTVNNNIANATTPGYSREIVDFSSAGTTQDGSVAIGDGVEVTGITSVQDQLLNVQLQQTTAAQASASAQSNVLSSVQDYFSSNTSGVGSDLSTFFTSLSALSSAPSNSADRQTVISDASALVGSFNSTAAGLTSTQTGLNIQVSGDVTQVNSLTAQIAALNPQIQASTAGGSDGGTLVDQRTELEQQLSALIGTSITTTPQGDTITTGNGSVLVAAGQSYALSTGTGSSGTTQVLDSHGTNITDAITGGDLGGSIQVRDTTIPGLLSNLDSLASGFGTAINAAQSSGYDLNGNAGTALFTLPSTVSGSAAGIALATTNGSAIAASSDGSSGSNGNVAALTSVQNNALSGGLSPTGLYAALVENVGNAASQADTQSTALQSSLTQLTNQQSSVSGVSIDEESSNLIRFQQGYEAAAEAVTAINSLFTTTIDMLSSSGA